MVSILGSYIIHSSKKNTGRIHSDPTTRRPPPGRTSDRAGGSKRGRRASRPQSRVYGVRAVVVVDIRSDPERVCTLRPTRGRVVESRKKARGSRLVVILERRERRPSPGPNGEISMPVTVHRRGGGREVRPMCAAALAPFGRIPSAPAKITAKSRRIASTWTVGAGGYVRQRADERRCRVRWYRYPSSASGGAGNEGSLRGRVRENGGLFV